MNFYLTKVVQKIFFCTLLLICFMQTKAQTDIDGLMMEKNFFCIGPTAGYSSWKNYWEGTNKRENLNMGRVSSTHFMLMGNYGLTKKINLLFGLPYIKTKASAGQLAGQKGLQDLSFFIKWQAWDKHIGKGHFKTFVTGGYSFPVSKYTPDLMPLSIGTHSKNAIFRLMADYQRGNLFASASGSFVYRSNVTLDRNTYYTTEMHYTNQVQMPDASQFNFRLGYRSETWIAEAILDKWTTLGGFDISKNNMPFVSNKMNATTLGFHIKYETNFVNGLSFVADGNTTIAGRNVGQRTGFSGGVFYILDFSKKKKSTVSKKTDNKTQTK
jgi:hypothetical protein